MLHSLEGHIEAVTSGCFLPSLQQSTFPAFAAATASKDGEVKVWDMNAGKEVESLSCGENLLSLAATRGDQGDFIAAGATSGSIYSFNLRTLEPYLQLKGAP
mmetsp:Transcript_10393/g.27234  ORF Transcript_10393/g.27234 Transcript_10393/m.27234 type:complete len:102 (+) Transcript_10393:78-383(+)